jgi:hypothetical protein
MLKEQNKKRDDVVKKGKQCEQRELLSPTYLDFLDAGCRRGLGLMKGDNHDHIGHS